MSLINNNLKKIIPPNVDEYKIGFDDQLGQTGSEIFQWLESNGKIAPTHTFNGITYRWAFGDDMGFNSVLNNLPNDLSELFLNNVINYLGIKDFSLNEIKFEKIGPNKYLDDAHLKRTRFRDLVATEQDDLPSDYNNTIFYSSFWHTDKFFELNNYKILVYLNDVEESQGGLVIADPIITPKWINNKACLVENSIIAYPDDGVSVKSDEITFKEVTGPKGTTASFNSHILHRANLPKDKRRFCMHLSFHLNESQYMHEKYSNNHFR